MIEVPYLPRAIENSIRNSKGDWDESKIHVSDLAVTLENQNDKKCPRQFWMRLRDYPKRDKHIGEIIMFDHGHRIHERLDSYIRDGIEPPFGVYACEMPVTFAGESITGTTDYILKNEETGELVVVDFKTSRGKAFYYLDENGPKESNVLQVQSYMYGLNTMEENPKMGLVLYVDREGQNGMRQFPVERDDERVKKAITQTREIAQQKIIPPKLNYNIKIRENKGPDSLYVNMPWQCERCDYLDISCGGALPKEYRTEEIVAKIDNNNVIKYKKGFEYFEELIGGELNGSLQKTS